LAFDEDIEKKLGSSMTKDDFKDEPDFTSFETPAYEPYTDEQVPASKMPDIDEIDDVATYDQYVGARARVPIGGEIWSGKVVRRNRELVGTVKGRANATSVLDTRTYEIEFPDWRSN
jgi:hypothetical protein